MTSLDTKISSPIGNQVVSYNMEQPLSLFRIESHTTTAYTWVLPAY
ncbi:hypothetical protein VCR20J5_1390056 [Vibrio crassostreae]|nr:hypothetical protein VCR20J5_1390056 [Vibrio crassostreae]